MNYNEKHPDLTTWESVSARAYWEGVLTGGLVLGFCWWLSTSSLFQ